MDLTFNQCATLLAAINAQATGRADLASVNTTNFVSVATTTLATGYDNVCRAISQVLSRTIFSVRPYERKFRGLTADAQRYGNHTRKITAVDSNPEEDERYKLEDGKSIDQQKVNKPKLVQTNFYNANVYQRHVTIFKDQLNVAFSGAEEFGRFISMVVQNVVDQMEQDHESCARLTLSNFIGGKIAGDTANVIHLVTEYKAATGADVTAATVRQSDNFVPFMKWTMARIRQLSELMTERTAMFHVNLADETISRHTPLSKQHVYLHAADTFQMETSVLSTVFHDEYLKKVDFETVNFWQSIKEPMSIDLAVVYMLSDGSLATATVTQDNVFGVMFDDEAVGYTVVNQWSAAAPFNAAGGYSNMYHHYTDRYWNDFTENGVVLLLD